MNKLNILVLDDSIERLKIFAKKLRGHTVDFVLTAQNCIYLLSKKHYDYFFADHDLGGRIFVDTNNKNTGAEVARWISRHPSSVKNTIVIIHSYNPAGAKYMAGLIPNSRIIPGIWLN